MAQKCWGSLITVHPTGPRRAAGATALRAEVIVSLGSHSGCRAKEASRVRRMTRADQGAECGRADSLPSVSLP